MNITEMATRYGIDYAALAAEFDANIDTYAAEIVAVINSRNTDYYTAWQIVSNRLYRTGVRTFAHMTGAQFDRLDAAINALAGRDVVAVAKSIMDAVYSNRDAASADVEAEILDSNGSDGSEVEVL